MEEKDAQVRKDEWNAQGCLHHRLYGTEPEARPKAYLAPAPDATQISGCCAAKEKDIFNDIFYIGRWHPSRTLHHPRKSRNVGRMGAMSVGSPSNPARPEGNCILIADMLEQ